GAACAGGGGAGGWRGRGGGRGRRGGGPRGGGGGGGRDDVPRLAAESDCLVIAAPHTAETQGAVDRRVLERLPRGAIVVNVSRGSPPDERALLEPLDAGQLRRAARHGLATEPPPRGRPRPPRPRV